MFHTITKKIDQIKVKTEHLMCSLMSPDLQLKLLHLTL